ncbi:hypothetical protein GGI23_003018, partial [Coemansia sp. RSA 2559]
SPQLGPQTSIAGSLSGSSLNGSMPMLLSSHQQQRQQYQMSPSLYTIHDTNAPLQSDAPAMHSSYAASNPQIVPSRSNSMASRYSNTSLPASSYASLQQPQQQQQQQLLQQSAVGGPQPSQYNEYKRRQKYEQQY